MAVFKAGKTLFIYDSFARKSAHILRKFDEQWGAHYRIVDTEKIPDQQGYQSDCGLRCVTWLLTDGEIVWSQEFDGIKLNAFCIEKNNMHRNYNK